MIRLFRKIRQQLLSEDKYSTYFLYALGEILLVIVGILLALQIDNQTQIRKDKLEAENLFQDLKISLQTDLKEIERVLEIVSLSLENQTSILTINTDEILANYDKDELIALVRNIWAGVNSFYPKLGVYNQIVSSNLMRLIDSPELMNTLMDYYDYKCTRYNTLDVVLDQKYHETFQAFMSEELSININLDSPFTPEFTNELVDQLRIETSKVYDLTLGVYGVLKEMKIDIAELLEYI